MSYIEFDEYKFNYIIKDNKRFIRCYDIVKFIEVKNVNNIIDFIIVCYDCPYFITYGVVIIYDINNVVYVDEKLFIYIVMSLNRKKYMKYKEVIEKAFGYKVIDKNNSIIY